MTKQEALKILEGFGNSPNMIKHALACGFVMRALCLKLITQPSELKTVEDQWEIVGFLHDADYEATDKDLQKHTSLIIEKLKKNGVSREVTDAIRGHFDKSYQKTLMAKAIYACDELTGLIVACALVQPDKKLKSVTTKSVLKKFKDSSFARGAHRDQIKTCQSELHIPLEEFISLSLKAMQDHASELGL